MLKRWWKGSGEARRRARDHAHENGFNGQLSEIDSSSSSSSGEEDDESSSTSSYVTSTGKNHIQT